jgi:hypothetical protein
MQFKLTKELKDGRFFVRVVLSEFTDVDEAKAKKFGVPSLTIKYSNGKDLTIPANVLQSYPVFGFYNQEDADQYTVNIKKQISELKLKWDNLEDTWSNEEVI